MIQIQLLYSYGWFEIDRQATMADAIEAIEAFKLDPRFADRIFRAVGP